MNEEDQPPKVGHLKVPLWIKIMWVVGIVWILTYIFQGLKQNPTDW